MKSMSMSVMKKIDTIVDYLTPFLPLANCHMVNYITQDHWNNLVPLNITNEVETGGIDSSIEVYWQTRKCLSDNILLKNEKFKHFIKFIEDADSHSVVKNELFVSLEELKTSLNIDDKEWGESLKVNDFMSTKKGHEVELLSGVVKNLYSKFKTTHTIDLGGGKGYLGSMLSIRYKMPVLNVDCSPINAQGAANRNKKLHRLWPGILKKIEKEKVGKDTSNDIAKLLESNLDTYRHVVDFVSERTDLLEITTENFQNCRISDDIKICLTGLHTCGSLGPTSLKLFVESHSVKVMCTVPCCYNLITEKCNENSLSANPEDGQFESFDFPMSSYMKGFNIGRNARMLAAQSVDRVSEFAQLPAPSIFYRALLEVLLHNIEHSDGKIKKVGSKCANFADYVAAALKKLNIEPSQINLKTEDMNTFEKKYTDQKYKLNAFYLLRLCLAPVIENLILLDRLMYLKENGFNGEKGDSHLVHLFDPVLSPRHAALIAYKQK